MAVTLNASTSSGFIQTADTSGELNLQSNGTTKLSVLSTGVSGVITSGTAVASTSGTSIDFTGIPSWVKRITVMLRGISTNGTSLPMIQIGSGSVDTSGYLTETWQANTSNNNHTNAFVLRGSMSSSLVFSGNFVLTLMGSNVWVGTGIMAQTSSPDIVVLGGDKSLSSTLDRVRITTVNGTDTFDAGSINILYEG
jgi:hypothetical protein